MQPTTIHALEQHFGLALKTAPVNDAVSRDDAKDFLRVDAADDNAIIDRAIESAIASTEAWLRRALITQTWYLYLDAFPTDSLCPIPIPLPPLQSIDAITYTDTAGDGQTWSSDDYQTDIVTEPGRVMPVKGGSWPTAQADTFNAVTIEFTAGYGDDDTDIPGDIQSMVLLLAAHLYVHRGPVITGMIVSDIPLSVESIAANRRIPAF